MKPPPFWYQESAGIFSRLTEAVLHPLAALYQFLVQRRLRSVKPSAVEAAVICVGNLTLGGTGKTPVAIGLLDIARQMDINVQALSRGYGGKNKGPLCVDLARHTAKDVGDEPLMLAATAPVWISRNRVAGAEAAILHRAELIIMDDGHQNPELHKDLSIVVIDADAGWGNGRIFPAGPLREPVEPGLSRANAIIVMTAEPDAPVDHDSLGLADLEIPVMTAWLEPAEALPAEPLFAFAGIGRPEKFFRSLAAAGGQLESTQSFPDHHVYSRSELRELRHAAEDAGAQLITTEKDYMRIPAAERSGITPWPVRVVFAEPARVTAWVQQALDAAAARR
ncbi:tetraacyldisaccharide 4'-kinase [Hyphobacterium sp.]|jgi:tetraacyldisaccharide 4'-kinase|uniref:tetraacyldisaccharide 4'-kinase n=1 Tax=Hyphobacterium sp. TaxID=2004662 RepID=UPI003BAC2A5B